MRKQYFKLLGIILLLTSCHITRFGYWDGAYIPSTIRLAFVDKQNKPLKTIRTELDRW